MNLATDEYLLELHRSGRLNGVTLYFYINDSAVIIGRNQNAWSECNIGRMNADGVQLVRRHTGGGAVFHDRGNLNFSFIANEKHYDKERQTRVILNACRSLGFSPEVNGRNDITVDGRKISGCAYAVSGTARGMHGTLLVSVDLERLSDYLNPSKKKLEAKGIASVRSRVMDLAELKPVTVEEVMQAVITAFTAEYGEPEELSIDPCNADLVRLAEKHHSWEWRYGMTPVFDYTMEERFSFGMLRLCLRLKNGRVESARVFTDALDAALPEEFESLLKGCRFDSAELARALRRGGAEAAETADQISREAVFEMITDSQRELVDSARRSLHTMAELSGGERRTKAFIIDFLKKNTSLRVCDMGGWVYAVHDEDSPYNTVFRADFDAVPYEGGARHLCGHDGHTASLLALALMLEGRTFGGSIILLFQHAEETGRGAEECCALFDKEDLPRETTRMFGAHNIPGEPFGMVLLRRGTFACASCGLELGFTGTPAHAAYPEKGVDPTYAVARLAIDVPEAARELTKKYSCMTLATVVGMRTGEKAFGVAASDGKLWLTLRSENGEAYEELRSRTLSMAASLAKQKGLALETKEYDPFPATVNDDALVDLAESVCRREGTAYAYPEHPFRWSEDFGHYGKRVRACFMGIGSGEGTAPLHTAGYEYPEGLAETTALIFLALARAPWENQ